MKAQEIVQRLALRLPMFTDAFTTNYNIISLTRVGSIVTATTDSPHSLKVSNQINIVGAESPIALLTLTRAGAIGTLNTDGPHDITKFSIGAQSVEISGANESEFNGSFVLLSRPNRETLTFAMPDTGATVATGTPLLLNGSSIFQGYNGLFAVDSAPSSTTFTYNITTTPSLLSATGTISARTLPRISSGISLERILDAYTVQTKLKDVWAFVILGDVIASKNRAIDSDASDNQQRGNEFRQQLIQPFTIITLAPATQEIVARAARDQAEDLFRPLCQSILFSKFDSGLHVGAQNPVMFVDHGFAFYDTAIYGHSYAFQTVADLTFDDTIGYDADVAFNDISMSMGVDIGTAVLLADIDLDDVPL